jgi:UDP-N-acetylglucosamine--N-acetylmuramyl-(pentapeptide) pyrophosphoryl-undecaprenol N-acetylglucosamine transferase
VDVVFCKGGYVALPVVFASKMLGRKLIVHESDVHPGLVNRIATKFASAVFTGFDGVLPKAKTVGQILGDEIVPAIIASSHTVRHNGTKSRNNSLPIIFLTAGSQGSKTLYETFAQVLKINLLIAESFQIFISLGKLNNQLKSLFPQKNVKTFDFLSQREMGEMYAKTDICLVRGGTTSLAEQKLFNIKSVIVPIPRTHDQMDNAKWYVEHYQDILLDQTSPTFLKDMENLFLSLRGYHKEEIKKDIFNEIQQAKKLIWKEILE